MHGNLGGGDDAVVGVGLEARLHATLDGLAGSIKGRLSDGVVGSEELKDDHVTDGDVVELIRLVDQATGATNSDSVCSRGMGNGGSLALGDGVVLAITTGDNSRMLASTDSDGLGDGDLLIVGLSGMLASGVGPDDDDLSLGVSREARAVHTQVLPGMLTGSEHGIATDGLDHVGPTSRPGHDHGRSGQCDSLRELHDDDFVLRSFKRS